MKVVIDMLLDEIKVSDIQINKEVKDWKEAIREASWPLVAAKKITTSYVDAMIHVVEEKGPYIVITKHIALAHARPEHGVLEKGLSFTTLGHPVPFGSQQFDPVKLIIALAATDSESHLDVLSDLADVLSDEEITQKLFEAKDQQEFLEILKSA